MQAQGTHLLLPHDLVLYLSRVIARQPESTHIEFLIVDVMTDDGMAGVGVSHTSGAGARTLESLVRDTLAPRLIGMEASPRAI